MRRTLALLLALLVTGGCSNDADQPPPAATVPSEVPTTSTTPPAPDPAVIPDDLAEIDEAYVQAVVDELFAVDAKATEIFVATKTLDEKGIKFLEAIYTKDELEWQLQVWLQTLSRSAGTLLPGALINDVTRIIDVTSDCLYVEVEIDYSNTTEDAASPSRSYLGLTPKNDNSEGSRSVNRTAWIMFMNGLNMDGSEPGNPCRAE